MPLFFLIILSNKGDFMKHVGIDIHANKFTCCYLFDDPKKKERETFNSDPEGLKSFYSTHR
jgi:hypothetical protein